MGRRSGGGLNDNGNGVLRRTGGGSVLRCRIDRILRVGGFRLRQGFKRKFYTSDM